MQFLIRKRRQPPAVIIVPLIDILLVLLIFLMVTSTFRQQPAVKLALPAAKQSVQTGPAEHNLVITIAREEPFFYLGARAVTLEKLENELASAALVHPKLMLSVAADEGAPWGKVVKVIDLAKQINVVSVNAFTRPEK